MTSIQRLGRADIARRAAQDLKDGMYVNLGVGLPTWVSQFVPTDREVIFQSENGILGVGPYAEGDEINPDLINAGQSHVTILPGASFFDCGQAFGMLRGGHVDLALLGAFQVSAKGDLASWNMNDPKIPPAVGGAMDIAAGVKEIWVLMQHCGKNGEPRLLEDCSYPVTARGVVNRVYTDLAVIDITSQGFLVSEILADISFQDLQRITSAPLKLNPERF